MYAAPMSRPPLLIWTVLPSDGSMRNMRPTNEFPTVTNNWPSDVTVGNKASTEALVWSIGSDKQPVGADPAMTIAELALEPELPGTAG